LDDPSRQTFNHNETPTEADHAMRPAGRRWSLLQGILILLALAMAVALILSVTGLLGGPQSALAPGTPAAKARPTQAPTETPAATPTITLSPIVVENTPTAENPMTAVAVIETATAAAAQGGSTPRPPNLATATPPLVVTPTRTPYSLRQATLAAAQATLDVLITGTSTATPRALVTATASPTYVVLTPEATPANAATAAARAADFLARLAQVGEATPLPTQWVTPLVVTATPTAANRATAERLTVVAYFGMLTGTPTATPANLWTATPSPTYVVMTAEATPANEATALARVAEMTRQATRVGTSTPLPANWVTPVVVTATPTAANQATAERLQVAAYLLERKATSTPTPANLWTPTPSPTYVIITSVPTPRNALTAQARLAADDMAARRLGTATRLPDNWVTPVVVTMTPTPLDPATRTYEIALATVNARTTGTPTPTPANLWTATATPWIDPDAVIYPTATYTPTMTPTADPHLIPTFLANRIGFLSDREGGEPGYYVMDADGGNVQRLTGPDAYMAALVRDTIDPSGQFQVFVSEPRLARKDPQVGKNYELSLRRLADGLEWYISGGARGADYNPAYCLAEPRYIAYTSQQSGGDDIYALDLLSASGDEPLQTVRLTENTWPWDKHPSWSPDCQQIVFTSNRDGWQQIYVMAWQGMGYPGGAARNLSRNDYNDWDPVWFK
jgi:hypothetical protein